MNKKKKKEIGAFYEMYKIEKGDNMIYDFKCTQCKKVFEVGIPIKDYDKLKNRQTCPECNGKMERVIEWNGIAEGSGEGWFGARGGNII